MISSPLLRGVTAAALALTTGLSAAPTLHAQDYRDRDPYADRYDRNGRYDAYRNVAQIEPGTFITVRTQQPIDTDRRIDRPFTAVVQEDVWDDYHRLAVPMIRRGSPATLLVRAARDGDLLLDLDSVTIGGQRYTVAATGARIESDRRGDRRDNNTGQNVAGGAILGTIIGAIAGGGKGAVVGGVAGAAVGAAISTQGRRVHVPAGSILTFRLDQGLAVGVRRGR